MNFAAKIFQTTIRLVKVSTHQLVLVLAGLGLVYATCLFVVGSRLSNLAIDRAFNEHFVGNLKWDRVFVGPLPWQVQVIGFSVEEPGGETIARVDVLELEYIDLADLLNGELRLDGINLSGVWARIREVENSMPTDARPGKLLNIEQAFLLKHPAPSPSTEGESRIQLRNVNVSRVDAEYSAGGVFAKIMDGRFTGVHFSLDATGSKTSISLGARELSASLSQVKVARGTSPDLQWTLSEWKAKEFTFLDDKIGVNALLGKLEGDPLDLGMFSMTMPSSGEPVFDVALQLTTSDILRHTRQFGYAGTSGPLNLVLKGRGSLMKFTGQLVLNSKALVVEEQTLSKLSVDIDLKEGRHLTFSRPSLNVFGGGVRFSGAFDLYTGTGRLQLTGDHLQISRLPGVPASLPDYLRQGDFDFEEEVTIENAFHDDRKLAVEGQVTYRGASKGHAILKRIGLASNLTYQGNKLTISQAQISAASTELELGGKVDFASGGYQVKGSLDAQSVELIASIFDQDLYGHLALQFSGTGRLSEPQVALTIAPSRLRYAKVSEVSLSGVVDYRNHIVSLSPLRLSRPRSSVNISGSVNLQNATPSFDVDLLTKNLDLEEIQILRPWKGTASVALSLQGTGRDPKITLDGDFANLCVPEGATWRSVCIDSIEFDGKLAEEKILVRSVNLTDRNLGMVQASGEYALRNNKFRINGRIVDFALAQLDNILREPLGIRGRLDVVSSVVGTPTNPVGSGRIQLQDLVYQDRRVDDLLVLAVANDKTVALKLTLFDGQKLDVNYPLSEDGAPSAVVKFKKFQPERWVNELFDLPLETEISGRIEGQFKDKKFTPSKIAFDLSNLKSTYKLDAFDVQAKSVENVRGVWSDSGLHLEQFTIRVLHSEKKTQKLSEMALVNTSGDITPSGDMNLVVTGESSLAGLHPFLKGTFSSAEGRIVLNGKVEGPATAPTPSFDIVVPAAQLIPRSSVVGKMVELVDPLHLTLSAETPGYSKLLIQQTFSGQQTDARLMRDESIFRINGLTVELSDFVPELVALSTGVRDLSVKVPGVIDAIVDAPILSVTWRQKSGGAYVEAPELTLGGRIEVQRGSFTQDITGFNELNQGVRNRLTGRTTASSVSVAERFPILKRLKLNLSVIGESEFFVRNRVTVLGLDLEIRLNLEKITGYLFPDPGDGPEEQLRLVGDLTILPDSTLTYAGRDFEVNRGVVDFGRGQFMDASIEASRTFTLRSNTSGGVTSTQFDQGAGDVRLEEVDLTARITQSTLDADPKISMNLSSNSGASKLDVAMLVLTGSYPENMSTAASAQPATQVLLAPLLNLVEKPLEDTLDVDLSLTPATTGSLYIDIDKNLSRRLRLYSRVFVGDSDDTSPQRFGLEYQINNAMIGEFKSQKTGSTLSTAGRLRLRLELD